MNVSLGQFSAHPVLGVTLLALVVLTFGISAYLALTRLKKHSARLTLVWASSVVASVCVIVLAIDIQVPTNKPDTNVLLTEGVTLEQLNTLGENSNYTLDNIQNIFVLEPTSELFSVKANFKATYKDQPIIQQSIVIQDPVQMFNLNPSLKHLHILGSGLNQQQWANLQSLVTPSQFDQLNIGFSPNKLPIGIVDISFQKNLVIGQYLEITGRLKSAENTSNENTIFELALLNPIGDNLETQRLKANETFTFNVPVKTQGQWQYRLQLSDPALQHTLVDEPIAVSVRTSTPLRILVKQSAPSFETRHFSNWASQFSTQLFIATQISKNKDIQQSINLNEDEAATLKTPLTLEALNTFDLLILDGRAVLSLSPKQTQAISSAIQQGLGVLILVDNAFATAWPLHNTDGLDSTNSTDSINSTDNFDWLHNLSVKPLDLANYSHVPNWANSNIDEPIDVTKAELSGSTSKIVVQGDNDKALVVKQSVGLGSVTLSLINNSHSWQTAGKTSQYSHFWQTLLSKVSKASQTPQWLPEQNNVLRFGNMPFSRCLLGQVTDSSETLMAILSQINSTQPAQSSLLNKHPFQANKLCVEFWPVGLGTAKHGWYELQAQLGLNPTTHGYIYSKDDWVVLRQSQAIEATQRIVTGQQPTQLSESYKGLNKFWIWLCLVLALSVLWVERKLF